jgi:hypothetical protein
VMETFISDGDTDLKKVRERRYVRQWKLSKTLGHCTFRMTWIYIDGTIDRLTDQTRSKVGCRVEAHPVSYEVKCRTLSPNVQKTYIRNRETNNTSRWNRQTDERTNEQTIYLGARYKP